MSIKSFRAAFLVASICLPQFGQAQLTTTQKLQDFQIMADQFSKRYAPALWKQIEYGVNIWNIKAFLDRVAATRNDLDFYDVCVDYTAQLRDGGHVYFGIPSDFVADTGLSVDTFDGQPLIYAINRTYLPSATYPIQIGDRIVSVDGTPAADLMASLSKYGVIANPRTAAAYGARYLTFRPQSAIPHAVDVPDVSKIAIENQDGIQTTYSIPWVKSGIPVRNANPVATPARVRPHGAGTNAMLTGPDTSGDFPDSGPLYGMIRPGMAISGIGALRPVFSLPAGFKIRLGGNPGDTFYSGTYTASGYTIGFIRIPSFSPSSIASAVSQFSTEVAYFQANTDALVVDDMRNPGGIIYYGQELARRLLTKPYRLVGFELRATSEWVRTYDSYFRFFGGIQAPDSFTAFYGDLLNDVRSAYSQNGGHTGPEPLDLAGFNPMPPDPGLDQSQPFTDKNGNLMGYTKPIIVLTDEFSGSTADLFPAVMQDNEAATIFGMRTMGLGGTNASYSAGAFSEGTIGMVRGLMVRKNPVTVPGYPTSNYIENVGVQPDIVEDYKTLDNLLHGGATFVSRFTSAAVDLIRNNGQKAN